MHCWRQNIHHAFSMLGLSPITPGFYGGMHDTTSHINNGDRSNGH